MFSKSATYTLLQNNSNKHSFCHAISDYLTHVCCVDSWTPEAVKRHINMTDSEIRKDGYETVVGKLRRCGLSCVVIYRDANSQLVEVDIVGVRNCEPVPIRISKTGHYDLVSSMCKFSRSLVDGRSETVSSIESPRSFAETHFCDGTEWHQLGLPHKTSTNFGRSGLQYATPIKEGRHQYSSQYQTPDVDFSQHKPTGAPIKSRVRNSRVNDQTLSELADRLQTESFTVSPEVKRSDQLNLEKESGDQYCSHEDDYCGEQDDDQQYENHSEQAIDESHVRKSDVVSARREYHEEKYAELHLRHTQISRELDFLQLECDKNSLLLSEMVSVISLQMRTVLRNEDNQERYTQHASAVGLEFSHFMIDALSTIKSKQQALQNTIRELSRTRDEITDEIEAILQKLQDEEDGEAEDGEDEDGEDEEENEAYEENSSDEEEDDDDEEEDDGKM